MAYSVEIINKNGKKFILQEAECKNVDYTMTSKLFKESLPDSSADNAIVINLGQEITINIPMVLRATDTDAANGSYSSQIKTVQEKFDYLVGVIFTTGLEDLYTINIYTTPVNILGKVGVLEGYSFNPTAERPNVLPGSISISIGGGKQ